MHIFAMFNECCCKVKSVILILGRSDKKNKRWKKLTEQAEQKRGRNYE